LAWILASIAEQGRSQYWARAALAHPHYSLARPGKFDKNTFLVYFYNSNVFKKIY